MTGTGPGARVPAIVFAAGTGSRFPGKLLAPVRGVPMIAATVAVYARSKASRVIVVVGHDAGRVLDALAGLPFETCVNPDYAGGKAASIAAVLRRLPPGAPGVLFAQGDMPFVRTDTVDRLLEAFAGSESILVPICERTPGSPKMFGSRYFGELMSLTGEATGMDIMRAHPEQVSYLPTDDPGVLRDVDTPAALHDRTEDVRG